MSIPALIYTTYLYEKLAATACSTPLTWGRWIKILFFHLYLQETCNPDGSSKTKTFQIPVFSKHSIYHEVRCFYSLEWICLKIKTLQSQELLLCQQAILNDVFSVLWRIHFCACYVVCLLFLFCFILFLTICTLFLTTVALVTSNKVFLRDCLTLGHGTSC